MLLMLPLINSQAKRARLPSPLRGHFLINKGDKMINLFLITFLACGDDEETDTSKLEVDSPQEEVVEESTEEVEGEE